MPWSAVGGAGARSDGARTGLCGSNATSSSYITPVSPNLLSRFGVKLERSWLKWMLVIYGFIANYLRPYQLKVTNTYYLTQILRVGYPGEVQRASFFSRYLLRLQSSSWLGLWSSSGSGAREFISKVTHLVGDRPSFLPGYWSETSISCCMDLSIS